jgi:hypothetical protein
MSLPFIKVRCSEWLDRASLVGWTLDNRAPVLWVDMDLAILTASGRLEDLSVRDLSTRWGWPKSTTARKVKQGVGRIWDSSGTVVGQERDTPAQVQPAKSDGVGTVVGQQRDSSGTHARSSIENEERLEVREQQTAQAPDVSLPTEPKKLSPTQQQTADGIACLQTLRGDYLTSKGKRASSWGKAKGTQTRVARFLMECRRNEKELGATPLETLEALGRWVFGAPGAQWLRDGSTPLEKALGGPVKDDSTRKARALDALAWVKGGQSKSGPPKSSRGKPEHWSVQLAREQAGETPERINITPESRLFGGTS